MYQDRIKPIFYLDKQFPFKVISNCTHGHDTLGANRERKTVRNVDNTITKNVPKIVHSEI